MNAYAERAERSKRKRILAPTIRVAFYQPPLSGEGSHGDDMESTESRQRETADDLDLGSTPSISTDRKDRPMANTNFSTMAGCACGSRGTRVARRNIVNITDKWEVDVAHESGSIHTNVVTWDRGYTMVLKDTGRNHGMEVIERVRAERAGEIPPLTVQDLLS